MSWSVDPELAELASLGTPTVHTDPELARGDLLEAFTQFATMPDLSGVEVEQLEVPGPPDGPDVAVRVYRPTGGAPSGVVLCFHGGGFYRGNMDAEHGSCVEIAREVGVVAVSVGYRLAPEHPYPAALDDCYAALEWVASTDEFGVESSWLGVQGASAGANLAAALCLRARDGGGPRIDHQFLAIPELDHRLATPSMRTFIDTPVWTRDMAAQSWAWYLRALDGDVPAYASPSLADDLSGLPSAYISVAELDPMRDEGIAYASALLAAGVPVELHCYPGTFHGSTLAADAEVSRRQQQERIDVLRREVRR